MPRPKKIAVALALLPLACSGAGPTGGAGGLASCDGSGGAAPPAGTCGLVCRAEIPITFEAKSPVATVWLNDKPARMLLDTGAAASLVTSAAQAHLGLPAPVATARKLFGIGGLEPSVKVTTVERIAFGQVRRETVPVTVAPLHTAIGVVPPDGILGDDILHDYEVELDFPHAVVRLYAGVPCEGHLPGWLSEDGQLAFNPALPGHHVIVPVTLEGRPEAALLDSGSEVIVVGKPLALEVGVPAAELDSDLGTVLVGIGPNRVPGSLHRFERLDVGGEQVTEVETAVVSLPFRKPGVILGADYLRTHKVWISYATGHVHVTHTW